MAKAHANSWEVTDEFWAGGTVGAQGAARPEQGLQAQRRGGPAAQASRLVFEAIVYVLRTGCQWKALPAERFGGASAVHQKFMDWSKAGFFEEIWKAGLAEYKRA